MTVQPIPEGYHSVTPYLIVDGADAAIKFYEKALGACEVMRIPGQDGKLGHAEIQIGDSRIMLADEVPEMGFNGPKTLNGCPVSLCLYVDDADATFQQAVDAGAKQMRPVQEQFYGDRSGTLEDPFGHIWTIATHIEDLTPAEIAQRMQSQS